MLQAAVPIAPVRLGSTPDQRALRRVWRVLPLLTAVALLSAGDLYMTLLYLTNVGMIEDNPLARGIMGYRSPVVLAAWKLAGLGLCLGILYAARRRAFGELGAWICVGILTWLTVRWSDYSGEIPKITSGLVAQQSVDDEHWVSMAQ